MRQWTKGIIASTVVIWAAWDIYMTLNGIPGDTISEIVWDWQYKYPLLVLVTGVILGHLFWQRRRKQ